MLAAMALNACMFSVFPELRLLMTACSAPKALV